MPNHLCSKEPLVMI